MLRSWEIGCIIVPVAGFNSILKTFRTGVDEDRREEEGEVQRMNYGRKAAREGDLTSLQIQHLSPGPPLCARGHLVETEDAEFSSINHKKPGHTLPQKSLSVTRLGTSSPMLLSPESFCSPCKVKSWSEEVPREKPLVHTTACPQQRRPCSMTARDSPRSKGESVNQ